MMKVKRENNNSELLHLISRKLKKLYVGAILTNY
jgi:hypothetical protein